MALEQGGTLPQGALIDDHLDSAARQGVDATAHRAIASWRRRVDDTLTIGGICLSDIWHSELYAEVFLPVARIVAGVRAALAAYGARELVCDGLDAELIEALRAEFAPLAVHARRMGLPPSYPSEEAAPPGVAASGPAWQRAARSVIDALGFPSVARGGVLVIPYLSTLSVLERLAAGDGPRPVLYTRTPPTLPLALRVARRGGWLGSPGSWSRHRARRDARRCLRGAARMTWPGIAVSGVERLLHVRALQCLTARALETTAPVAGLQSLFCRGGVRAVVLPFDHEPVPKTIVRVAQRVGVPTLYVQHGYEPYRVFHTGTLADFAAVWSQADRMALPQDVRSRARVVGNPRTEGIGSAVGRGARGQRVAIVLAEHHSRHSAILDRRVTAQHLSLAIAGLRASSCGWQILVRPHPSDDVAAFERMVAALGGDGIEVDGHSSATDLLARADLCVGALSTMTLEAALSGTRVVMLNPEGISWTPPLQRDGPVPTAQDGPELARLIDAVMRAPEPPGAAALLEGFGVGPPDPAGAVVDWVTELITAD